MASSPPLADLVAGRSDLRSGPATGDAHRPWPRSALPRGAAGWLIATLLALACGAPRPSGPSLLVVTLDTTRRDHLSLYGYERPTSPILDELGRGALVFDQAFAQETNTNPSHASMLTGLYPHRHGNTSNGRRLDPSIPTLATLLRAAGFRTAGIVSGATMRSRLTAFDRGFELWDDAFEGDRRPGGETVTRALDWLEGVGDEERFFLLVHLFDPHGPYGAPVAFRGLFVSPGPGPRLGRIPEYQRRYDDEGRLIEHAGPYVDLYDAAIRSMDAEVGRLLGAVDPSRTVIAVLGDHGESLAERSVSLVHGGQVFDEQLRIPWLLRLPDGRHERRTDLVETVDLLPTLLDALDLGSSGPPNLDGRSLLAPERSAEARRAVFATARAESVRFADRGYALDATRRIATIRTRRWKLVRYPGREEDYLELYDLAADPGETRNVAAEQPGLVSRLGRRLEGWQGVAAVEAPPPELRPEEKEHLESLGYL